MVWVELIAATRANKPYQQLLWQIRTTALLWCHQTSKTRCAGILSSVIRAATRRRPVVKWWALKTADSIVTNTIQTLRYRPCKIRRPVLESDMGPSVFKMPMSFHLNNYSRCLVWLSISQVTLGKSNIAPSIWMLRLSPQLLPKHQLQASQVKATSNASSTKNHD